MKTTLANYDEAYHRATLKLDTLVSNDGWPSQAERGKRMADVLNNTWVEGLDVLEWVDEAAKRMGVNQ